jgi:hypothetical protein
MRVVADSSLPLARSRFSSIRLSRGEQLLSFATTAVKGSLLGWVGDRNDYAPMQGSRVFGLSGFFFRGSMSPGATDRCFLASS